MDNSKLVSDLSRILEGLDSSQEQLEKDAFDVINSSDTSLNLVKESISSVEEILKMITELNEIAEESAARIKELEKLSKDIEQFAGVIASISSRTNILSLNASIEAARAGEAGKGFAVVADQIRTLAEQSAKSAVNTRELIEESIREIEVGNKAAERTEKVLVEVVEAIHQLADNSKGISETSVQQAESMGQADAGVTRIADIIQSNSATAEETSATSEELSAQATSMDEIVARFSLTEE